MWSAACAATMRSTATGWAILTQLSGRSTTIRWCTTKVLRFLADQVGADRIMLGSDMPFPIGDLAPAGIVAEAGFLESEIASITGGLAQRLFVR